jgi:Mg-chelatase subunit ChlD
VSGGSIGFVIDTSGSMDEGVAGTAASERSSNRVLTRLRAAKEQMLLAVQAMDPDSQYSLWTFAGQAHLWTSHPVRPSPNSTRSLTELLSRLHPHGGTNLFDGLSQALQLGELKFGEQHETKIDELFVLSDGEPTAGEVRETDDMLRIVREANKYAKVHIHCVFTGTGPGADLLRRLAAENGGVFVQR